MQITSISVSSAMPISHHPYVHRGGHHSWHIEAYTRRRCSSHRSTKTKHQARPNEVKMVWSSIPLHVCSQASRYPSLALRVTKNTIGRFIKIQEHTFLTKKCT